MAWTLITGGARRLGADLSFALAKAGNDVVIHYRSRKNEAMELAKRCQACGVNAEIIDGDFSSVESTQDFIVRYISRFPDTKVLINNVGNYLVKPILETSIEEWTTLFQANLHAPLALIQALAGSIVDHRGSIINIGVSGLESSSSVYFPAYQSTKLGLLALTRSLAKDMAPFGVRVNMVSPGYLDIADDLPEELNKIPMKRAGKCEEVSRVVLFLIDPFNEYVTGQNIEVAGGVGL